MSAAIRTAFSSSLEAVQKQSHGTMTTALRAVADNGRIAAEQAQKAAKQAAEWATANPGKAAMMGTSAAVIAAPMVVASPALAVFGFTANGVAGGSIAAGLQGANVVAGGLFATLQSAAAGGYGVAAVSGAVQGIAATTVAAAGYSKYRVGSGEDGNPDADANSDTEKDKDNNPKDKGEEL